VQTPTYPDDAWDLLGERLTPARRERLLAAASHRTRHIRLVIQDIHDPHNVSACIRSADAFGVQDVDVVTMKEKFKPSTVARGVAHWMTISRYYDVPTCVADLRSKGYRIAAGVPRPDAKSLYDLPLDQKIAVVFGNEHAGIAPEWLAAVDTPFTIPMFGLVESLNISVSAAVTLAHMTHAAREALTPARYRLADAERRALLNEWICVQTPSWEMELERRRKGRPSS
jgi:tRNA (guanosine-2'-O-)-methyltransferase